MMLSIHCILGLPLLLLPSIFYSSSVGWILLSRTRWPKNSSFLFLIVFTNSLWCSPFSLLLHLLMLSIHCILGLSLLLLPSIFPSSSVRWMLLRCTIWPKNFSFLFLIVFVNSLLMFALLITSSCVVLSVHLYVYCH